MFQSRSQPRRRTNAMPASSSGVANIERIVVVTKKTPLQELVFKQNSKAQARFYLEQNHVSFHEYEVSDFQYQRALEAVRAQLPSHVKQHIIERDFLPTYQFREHDLIVTLGPDGLVMNTAKYLTTQPILALNPDPARIDGVLIPFHYPEAGRHIEQALHGAIQITPISMVKATLNDGQVLYGVNDLFIGIRGHSSARYVLEFAGQREQQSSSGMIVSTGAGSTGWMRSITLGAWHIARSFGQQTSGAPPDEQLQLGWSSSSLWFAVREPFPSKTSQVNLVFGQIPAGQELVITSQMPDNGIIFSDGIESDFLAFNSGFIARIGLAERKAHLITG